MLTIHNTNTIKQIRIPKEYSLEISNILDQTGISYTLNQSNTDFDLFSTTAEEEDVYSYLNSYISSKESRLSSITIKDTGIKSYIVIPSFMQLTLAEVLDAKKIKYSIIPTEDAPDNVPNYTTVNDTQYSFDEAVVFLTTADKEDVESYISSTAP